MPQGQKKKSIWFFRNDKPTSNAQVSSPMATSNQVNVVMPKMPDSEMLEKMFEKLLEETSMPESGKQKLRETKSEEAKWMLIQQHIKQEEIQATKGTPDYFVHILLDGDPPVEEMQRLRIELSTWPLSKLSAWVDAGGVPALQGLMARSLLKTFCPGDNHDMSKIDEIINLVLRCFKAVMNTRVGLDAVIRTPLVMRMVTFTLGSKDNATKGIAMELMAACCFLDEDGAGLILDGLEHFKVVARESEMFETIVSTLLDGDSELKRHTLTLINALLATVETLEERQGLRRLLATAGLEDVLNELRGRVQEDSSLTTQISIYEECRSNDDKGLNDMTAELSSSDEVGLVRNIRVRLHSSKAQKSFSSILGSLWMLVSDTQHDNLEPAWAFLDQVVAEIALTYDAEEVERLQTQFSRRFRSTSSSSLQGDAKPGSRKPSIGNGLVPPPAPTRDALPPIPESQPPAPDSPSKPMATPPKTPAPPPPTTAPPPPPADLDAEAPAGDSPAAAPAPATSEETDNLKSELAKLQEKLEVRQKEFDEQLAKMRNDLESAAAEASQAKKDLEEAKKAAVSADTCAPPGGAAAPPPAPGAPPPPPPGAGPPPPPGAGPPPPPGAGPPPPPGAGPPPPPGAGPPPPPGAGPPPPPGAGPPPPPGAGPPPPPGGGPPPPPGAGPPPAPGGPPPPPGAPGAPPPPGRPAGRPDKRKATPNCKTKGVTWTKIANRNVDGTIWSTVDDEKVTFDKRSLEELFAAKEAPKKEEKEDTGPKKSASSKTQIIDFQRGNNIAIMLSQFRMSFSDIRDSLFSVDDRLSLHNLLSLQKYVPQPEEVEAVNSADVEYNNLGKAEQYIMEVSKVPRLATRLRSQIFYLKFDTMLEDADEIITAVELACKEVKNAKSFSKLLELILALGNYLNGTSFRGGAWGFKLDGINKLSDTKSTVNPRLTLLHHLTAVVETKHPKLASFAEELQHVQDGARAELAEAAKDVGQLRTSVTQLEAEIKAMPNNPHDKFSAVMEPFLKTADTSVKKLEEKLETVNKSFQELAAFYGEDPKTAQPAEFFGIIHRFTQSYERAQRERVKIEEEMKKKASQAQAASSSGVPKLGVPGGAGEKGLMDNVLASLKGGDAFRNRAATVSKQGAAKRRPSIMGGGIGRF